MAIHAQTMRIGDWAFDPSTRRLCGRRGERRLSPKAAGVLLALAETPGRTWSRDALLERVWPDVTVGEEVLTHAVAELRHATGDDFRVPRLIETIHKSGYRLLAEVGDRGDGPRRSDAESGGSLDLRSYADYLEASALFEHGGARNWERALQLFDDSVKRDPGFAPSHAGAAKTLLFLAQYCAPRVGALDRALEHCATARRLAPDSGEAVAVEGLAHAMFGSGSRALQLFGRALRLAPLSNEVHHLLGRACFAHLEPGLAPAILERATALRQDDFQSPQLAATACEMIGDYDRARSNFAIALRRTDEWLHLYPGAYKAVSGKAHCLVQLGRREEAGPALESVCAHPDPVRHSPACVLALAGELDSAMDALEQSIDEGWHYAAWLRRDPCLNALRRAPRFQRIARSIDP